MKGVAKIVQTADTTIKMARQNRLAANRVVQDNTPHLKLQHVEHVLLVSTNLLLPLNIRVPFVCKVSPS